MRATPVAETTSSLTFLLGPWTPTDATATSEISGPYRYREPYITITEPHLSPRGSRPRVLDPLLSYEQFCAVGQRQDPRDHGQRLLLPAVSIDGHLSADAEVILPDPAAREPRGRGGRP